MTNEIEIHFLTEADIGEIVAAFKKMGWNKPKNIYEKYLIEQANNLRSILVAKQEAKFCGYVTIKWKSDYRYFRELNIPEIVDLNVLSSCRNRGIGSRLIAACEEKVRQNAFHTIGIGVGMTADYGNAQRLYVRLGYVPDGQGLHYQHRAVSYADAVVVDDDLALYFTKQLK